MTENAVAIREQVGQIASTLEKMDAQLRERLPSHIDPAFFRRVTITAVQKTPYLLKCDKRSLYESCLSLAAKGLVPDGRKAALVPYKGKVQDITMKEGYMDLARQSGQVSYINAHVVYEKDEFDYELGDDDRLTHKPYLGADDAGKIIAAYAVARLKDGSTIRRVMPMRLIAKRRAKSGQPDGFLWKEWEEKGCEKTVIIELCKFLPSSTDRDHEERMAAAVAEDDGPIIEHEEQAEQKQQATEAPRPRGRPRKLDVVRQAAAPEQQGLNPVRQEPLPPSADEPVDADFTDYQPGDDYDAETGEFRPADEGDVM